MYFESYHPVHIGYIPWVIWKIHIFEYIFEYVNTTLYKTSSHKIFMKIGCLYLNLLLSILF